MLTKEQRRNSMVRGERSASETLKAERARNGNEGVESCAQGMLDSIGRDLCTISPEYAHQALMDEANRIARLIVKADDA